MYDNTIAHVAPTECLKLQPPEPMAGAAEGHCKLQPLGDSHFLKTSTAPLPPGCPL